MINTKFLYPLLLFASINCKEKRNAAVLKSNNTNYENKMKVNIPTPLYALKIEASANFQIYVNDILVAYYYQKGATSLTIPINREILCSGEQNIRIVLHSNDKLNENELKYYKFKVLKYDSFDSPNYSIIVDCKFDENRSKNLNDFIQEWNFHSDVPYKVTGWSESVNLVNEDKDQLLKEVVEVYNSFREILQRKDAKNFLKKTTIRDEEINKALYLTPADIQKDQEQIAQTIKNISNVLPLENYKPIFYGKGKMVSLIKIDDKNKDESALQAKLNDNSTEIYELILYRPQKGGALEVIR